MQDNVGYDTGDRNVRALLHNSLESWLEKPNETLGTNFLCRKILKRKTLKKIEQESKLL